MKLDHIGLPGETEPEGAEAESSCGTEISTRLGTKLMYFLVHDAPFGGQAVLIPELLDVDERALPFTEEQMLERGEWDEVVFGVHAKKQVQRFTVQKLGRVWEGWSLVSAL